MHASTAFLQTLALVLGVAALTTVVFQRLRQPVVFGYLMAGLLVGPHVPVPLAADPGIVHTLSGSLRSSRSVTGVAARIRQGVVSVVSAETATATG